MARALIRGLLQCGFSGAQLRVGEPMAAQREALQRDLGVVAMADNQAAVRGADLVVLAVKPQYAIELLTGLCPDLAHGRTLLLSIAAGLRVADLAHACPSVPVVRAMPNRAALVGMGAAALYAPAGISSAQRALAEQVCAAAGNFVWVRAESDLDIVTALSGSGPAYFFQLAEHLAAAAVAEGLDAATAEQLARQTLRGAGALAGGDTSLAAEREAVTSKGGTTAAALAAFQAGGFDRLVAAAVAAARRRSAELAAQFGSTSGAAPH
ncbi:MAG: pyrroline-5-carboxylate reductase [Proteobacteria bacterium]|nr:pyrroline-5-carboxylate reductase [Pseudomonadota bacterium]